MIFYDASWQSDESFYSVAVAGLICCKAQSMQSKVHTQTLFLTLQGQYCVWTEHRAAKVCFCLLISGAYSTNADVLCTYKIQSRRKWCCSLWNLCVSNKVMNLELYAQEPIIHHLRSFIKTLFEFFACMQWILFFVCCNWEGCVCVVRMVLAMQTPFKSYRNYAKMDWMCLYDMCLYSYSFSKAKCVSMLRTNNNSCCFNVVEFCKDHHLFHLRMFFH